MMNTIQRRKFLAGLICGLAAATPAAAQDYVEDIVRQLRKQGFSKIVQERTLLGRVRIVATSREGQREIILNPNTGEILRDLWTPAKGSTRKIDIVEGGKTDDGGGDGDDDDGDDGDDDDGEGGDDNDDESSGGSGGDSDDDSNDDSDDDDDDSDSDSDDDSDDDDDDSIDD